MNKENRPHSREKTVRTGTANVSRGRKVDTGSRPVGFGGRNEGSSGRRSTGRGVSMGGFGIKGILALIVLAVIVIFALKLFGGLGSTIGNSGYSGQSNWNSQSSWNTPTGGNTGWNTQTGTQSGWNTQTGGNLWGGNTPVENASYSAPDRTVSPLAREKFYTPEPGDTVTVMIYMCGTDLESKYGMATKDLNEMLGANLSDNVNVIVLTGGCKQWKNNTMSNRYNQIYKLGYKSIDPLEENFGTLSMTDPKNLAQFIQYCDKNFPADRNILIFWDHGGGSLSGYGYDEKDDRPSSMTLAKVDDALQKGGVTFDFIGFDACLMATLETDLVCSHYADYLVASEETEPGIGWYYTNWLTKLSQNTAIPTLDLAQVIIDDYVSACRSNSASAQVTLSVVDLAELSGTVPASLRDFSVSTSELIQSDGYQQVSDARAGARQFSAKNKLNQIDLIDLAERVGTDESEAFAKALQSCVKYNKTTISRSHGISMYFPYETTKSVKSALASYDAIGEDGEYAESMEEYSKCIQSFASLEYGGQIAATASQQAPTSASYGDLGSLISYTTQSGSSTSPVTILPGGSAYSTGSAGYPMDVSSLISLLSGFRERSMPTEYDWVDTDMIADRASYLSERFIDPSRLCATTKNGRKVLELTDGEWSLIQTAELNVFAYDGAGYIDLGLDNTFEWLDDNAMLLEYDGTWLTLNGNVCAYYLVSDTQQSDGSWVTVGRIPALLNGNFVNLQVVFDDENPEGTVTGAYPLYEDSGIDVLAKGDIEIVPGDEIELLCDFYDKNGNYSASYTLGTSFKVPQDGLSVYNMRINTQSVSLTYRLTDLYGNHFWVPFN